MQAEECRDRERGGARSRLRGVGCAGSCAAQAARRRTAQHRLRTHGGEDRLRHLGRGRTREGDRRSGRRRSRNDVPALRAALRPGRGCASAGDRRLRRRGPGADRGARAGNSTGEVAPPLHRVPRDQTRTRGGAALRRPVVPGPGRLLLAAARACSRIAARRRGSGRRDPFGHRREGPADRRRPPVRARPGRGLSYSRRMVAVLIDGLRYGTEQHRHRAVPPHEHRIGAE